MTDCTALYWCRQYPGGGKGGGGSGGKGALFTVVQRGGGNSITMWQEVIPAIIIVALMDLYVLDRRIYGCPQEEGEEGTKGTTTTTLTTPPKKNDRSGRESPDRTLSTNTDDSWSYPRDGSSKNASPGAFSSPTLRPRGARAGTESVPNRIVVLPEFEEPSPLMEPSRRIYRDEDNDDDDGRNPSTLFHNAPVEENNDEDENGTIDSWLPQVGEDRLPSSSSSPLVGTVDRLCRLGQVTEDLVLSSDVVVSAAERLEGLLALRTSMMELSTLYSETQSLEDHWNKEKERLAMPATLIQRAFHEYRRLKADQLMADLRRQWQEQQDSAKVLQGQWRKVQERRNLRHDAPVVRECLQGQQGQHSPQGVTQQVDAVIKLQAWTRTFLGQQRLRPQRRSTAVFLPTAARSSQVEGTRREKGCIVVQRTYRGYRARQNYQTNIQAVIQLQKWYQSRRSVRHWIRRPETLAQHKKRVRRHRKDRAAIALHHWALNVKNERSLFVYRELRAQEDTDYWNAAATIIQSVYRCHRETESLRRYKRAAESLQRWYRCIRDKSHYGRIVRSVVHVQALVRKILAKRNVRTLVNLHLHRARVSACVKIQSLYRASQCRASYDKAKQEVATQRHGNAVRIQRVFRRYLAFLKNRDAAATIIQSVYRCHREEESLRRHKCAAETLQRWYRCIRDQSHYGRIVRSVVHVQALVRKILAKRNVRTLVNLHLHRARVSACVKIQSLYRASQCRASYHKAKQEVATQRHRKSRRYKIQTPPRKEPRAPDAEDWRGEGSCVRVGVIRWA